jgi:hypothetical protein
MGKTTEDCLDCKVQTHKIIESCQVLQKYILVLDKPKYSTNELTLSHGKAATIV